MILTADDVEEWPAGRLERLLNAGLLHEAANARSVVCDACAEGHVEEVQLLESPPGSGFRGYIVCPENGRVRVPLARLRQWEIDLSGLAQALAAALPAAGGHEEVVSGRVWLVGKSTLGGQSRDVFLVRGAAWSDFRAVVARARRFQEATNPAVLVADIIPSQEVWDGDIPTVFAMRTLTRLEDSSLTVDRDLMNRVLGRGRRRAAPVSVVTVPTPQGARWEDLSLVVDEFEFAFQVLGKRGKRGFKDCGCENRVKGDFPDHVWALLRLFARDRGRLVEDALEPKMRDNLKQYVSELRKRLQAVFPAIGGDPIVKPPGEHYKTAFRITARDGIVLRVPAGITWSGVSIIETRDGRIRFIAKTKERFLAYGDGRAEDRPGEAAERPSTTTWEYDLWTLGLLDDDGDPNPTGNALLAVLRAGGGIKRDEEDKAMFKLCGFLSRLTGIDGSPFHFDRRRQEWIPLFEADSERTSR
jgi:hypothetical protein